MGKLPGVDGKIEEVKYGTILLEILLDVAKKGSILGCWFTFQQDGEGRSLNIQPE